jgi:peptidylprolyl isomerase
MSKTEKKTYEEKIAKYFKDAQLGHAKRFSKKYFRITQVAYLDIEIDGMAAGRLMVGVFGLAVPKTAKNFLGIC